VWEEYLKIALDTYGHGHTIEVPFREFPIMHDDLASQRAHEKLKSEYDGACVLLKSSLNTANAGMQYYGLGSICYAVFTKVVWVQGPCESM